ncbi:MAG: cob(I)yrinic acid a,c-diamide adenosyltransferase, partial [Akkermansia sp.]
ENILNNIFFMTTTRVLVITGDGKGKTTSAFGMALRALGYGGRVSVVQFVKHDGAYGEVTALRQFAGAEVVCAGLGFTPKQEDSPQWGRHREAARAGWELALSRLEDDSVKMVILDEFFYPIRFGAIALDEAQEAVRRFVALGETGETGEERETRVDRVLVMTGRNAPKELVALSDTVSRVECVKHALQEGCKAQEGFEY